jgi:hypothetical protein
VSNSAVELLAEQDPGADRHASVEGRDVQAVTILSLCDQVAKIALDKRRAEGLF